MIEDKASCQPGYKAQVREKARRTMMYAQLLSGYAGVLQEARLKRFIPVGDI